jgi:hypothetical protein
MFEVKVFLKTLSVYNNISGNPKSFKIALDTWSILDKSLNVCYNAALIEFN